MLMEWLEPIVHTDLRLIFLPLVFLFVKLSGKQEMHAASHPPPPPFPLLFPPLPPNQTLGFHRLHEYKFDSFSLYFLYVPTPEEKASLPPCGTKESEKFLWSMKGTVLELTW
jgi:hypothetical protein